QTPGDDRRSFLLLGDGHPWTVDELKAMPSDAFRGVSLVTLSACGTGLGFSAGGTEADSIGAWMRRKGADAVLSTLWPVEDRTTGVLMARFYSLRKAHPEWSKLGALRKAQLELMEGNLTVGGGGRRRATSVSAGGRATKATFKAPPHKPFA